MDLDICFFKASISFCQYSDVYKRQGTSVFCYELAVRKSTNQLTGYMYCVSTTVQDQTMEAAVSFLEKGIGRTAVITSIDSALAGFQGKTGTIIE